MRFKSITIAIRAALGLAALAGASVAAAAMLSSVFVPPGGEVVLGNGGADGFAVSGQNTGPVALGIVARAAGKDRRLATVEPGGRLNQGFAPRETGVLVNTSSAREAVAMVRMTDPDGNVGAGTAHVKYERP